MVSDHAALALALGGDRSAGALSSRPAARSLALKQKGVTAPLSLVPSDWSPFRYLNADDLGAYTAGAAVDSWPDRITGSATQATAASRPTKRAVEMSGKPTVQFDGGDFLSYGTTVDWPAEFTVLAVCQMLTYVANAGPVGCDVTNGTPRIFQLRFSGASQAGFISYHAGGGSSVADTTAITGATAPGVLACRRTSSEARVFWNGTSDPGGNPGGLAGNTSAVAPLLIGGSARAGIQLFNGYISAVVCVAGALTDAQITAFQARAHSIYSDVPAPV